MKTFREFLREVPEPEFFGGEPNKSSTYCDLDGVLADFYGGAERVLGEKFRGTPEQWQEIVETKNFWADLPFLVSGRKLWSHIRKQGPFILTALPAKGNSLKSMNENDQVKIQREKMLWIGKNLPSIPKHKIIVVPRRNKQLYAVNAGRRPNLLIDDSPENIKEWEEAGGIGILHRSETVDKTITRLKKLGY